MPIESAERAEWNTLLAEAKALAGLTPTDIAEKLQMSVGSMSAYKNGATIPQHAKLQLLKQLVQKLETASTSEHPITMPFAGRNAMTHREILLTDMAHRLQALMFTDMEPKREETYLTQIIASAQELKALISHETDQD